MRTRDCELSLLKHTGYAELTTKHQSTQHHPLGIHAAAAAAAVYRWNYLIGCRSIAGRRRNAGLTSLSLCVSDNDLR